MKGFAEEDDPDSCRIMWTRRCPKQDREISPIRCRDDETCARYETDDESRWEYQHSLDRMLRLL